MKINHPSDERKEASLSNGQTATQRELIEHQEDVERGHLELFRQVEFFCGFRAERNPVTAINDLLHQWLSLPTTYLLGNEHHQHQLYALLDTVNFITACQVHLKGISYYQNEVDFAILKIAREAEGGGVDRLASVAPAPAGRLISLAIDTIADTAERPAELHVLREALLFYKEHLLQLGESNPASLLSADTANDILENLTAEAFTALGGKEVSRGE